MTSKFQLLKEKMTRGDTDLELSQETMGDSISTSGEFDTPDKRNKNCVNSYFARELNDQKDNCVKKGNVLNLSILKGGELERELLERKVRKNWIFV